MITKWLVSMHNPVGYVSQSLIHSDPTYFCVKKVFTLILAPTVNQLGVGQSVGMSNKAKSKTKTRQKLMQHETAYICQLMFNLLKEKVSFFSH